MSVAVKRRRDNKSQNSRKLCNTYPKKQKKTRQEICSFVAKRNVNLFTNFRCYLYCQL